MAITTSNSIRVNECRCGDQIPRGNSARSRNRSSPGSHIFCTNEDSLRGTSPATIPCPGGGGTRSKYQTPSFKEAPSSKLKNRAARRSPLHQVLGFGVSRLGTSLELGVCCLVLRSAERHEDVTQPSNGLLAARRICGRVNTGGIPYVQGASKHPPRPVFSFVIERLQERIELLQIRLEIRLVIPPASHGSLVNRAD